MIDSLPENGPPSLTKRVMLAASLGVVLLGGVGIGAVLGGSPASAPLKELPVLGHSDDSGDSHEKVDSGVWTAEVEDEAIGDREDGQKQLVTGYCDFLPSEHAQNSTFAASIDVSNHGATEIVMNVWAEFPQSSAEAVRLSESVEVSPGETVSVYLHSDASDDEIDRFRSVERECEIGGSVAQASG